MHSRFRALVDRLLPAFDQLLATEPITVDTIPRHAPSACVYLFTENGKHMYVGRTRQFKKRMGQHRRPSSQDNQAVFAFRLAREITSNPIASYRGKGRRKELMKDPVFFSAFQGAKIRIRVMDLRYVEEPNAVCQMLLEAYAAVVLDTPYNNFETT